MLTALELRILGYGLLAILVMAGTAYATHRLDSARYEGLQADFSKYQAQVAVDSATAHKAYADAIQAQIDRRSAQEAANAKTVTELKTRLATSKRDDDFARRLLLAAKDSGSKPADSSVPGTGHQPRTPGTPPASGDRPAFDLSQTLSAAAGECRDAIERFQALQAELNPQLR